MRRYVGTQGRCRSLTSLLPQSVHTGERSGSNDAALATRAAGGHAEAFRAPYDRYVDAVERFRGAVEVLRSARPEARCQAVENVIEAARERQVQLPSS